MKTEFITIRISKVEKNQIKTAATAAGIQTISGFIYFLFSKYLKKNQISDADMTENKT